MMGLCQTCRCINKSIIQQSICMGATSCKCNCGRAIERHFQEVNKSWIYLCLIQHKNWYIPFVYLELYISWIKIMENIWKTIMSILCIRNCTECENENETENENEMKI